MSVSFVPMAMAHLVELRAPKARDMPLLATILSDLDAHRERMVNEWSWTAVSSGQVAAVAGINPARNVIWAFLRNDLKREMLTITRFARSMCAAHLLDVGPVWADVDESYAPAVRWIEQLYFRRKRRGLWVRDFSTTP